MSEPTTRRGAGDGARGGVSHRKNHSKGGGFITTMEFGGRGDGMDIRMGRATLRGDGGRGHEERSWGTTTMVVERVGRWDWGCRNQQQGGVLLVTARGGGVTF